MTMRVLYRLKLRDTLLHFLFDSEVCTHNGLARMLRQDRTQGSYFNTLACSLITISVVSARGLLTRDAIVVESVSMMILDVLF